jgi:hypothetical protein
MAAETRVGKMITVLAAGEYILKDNGHDSRMLVLDDQSYSWYDESLEFSHANSFSLNILTRGNYRIYQVEGERNLTPGVHLEMSTGGSHWQGYVLPEGLPNWFNYRRLMIPTSELVSRPMVPGR